MTLASDHEWARTTVAELPRPWAARLLSQWEKRRGDGEGAGRRIANEVLRTTVAGLAPVNDVLPLDAGDFDICSHAWAMAERCRARLLALEQEQEHAPTAGILEAIRGAGIVQDAGALDAYEQRCALARIVTAAGIEAPAERIEDRPAVRRMVAAQWWRGRLRRAHGKAQESAAVKLSLVAKDRQCYVSDVGLQARTAQNARNAAALENTLAVNLDSKREVVDPWTGEITTAYQEFTLATLAAKGTANKAIRRAELMTRINGFERIAIAAGHAGLFLTITCPSRMHRRKMQGERTVENGKWDGTTPDQAQAYLREVWARIRAALARRKVQLYGFRIAEPQHDGTPHWHCLFFYETQHDAVVRAMVRRYALADSGDEAGAQEKRVDFRTMDPAKGTAAGYIAKYVAKNIDGYRLDKDLYGNDSLETSARVEAWASRWRIRQFQQIGGPPVTVWRELRRVENVPADAPDYVRRAHAAVNRVAVYEGRDNASVAWDHYVQAQGGVAVGRAYRVRLATCGTDRLNRYGEQVAAAIVGVSYFEAEGKIRDALGNWTGVEARTTVVKSKRYNWLIKPGRASRGAGTDNTSFADEGHAWARSIYTHGFSGKGAFVAVTAASAGVSMAAQANAGVLLTGSEFDAWAVANPDAAREWSEALKRPQVASWTCVNNCTGAVDGTENGRGDRRQNRGGDTAGEDCEAIRRREKHRREVSGGSHAADCGRRTNLMH